MAKSVALGRLHRLHRGVYAVGHTRGLVRSPLPLEGTGPVPRGHRLPIVIHRARRLTEADRAAVDGIPLSAVPRTTLDMAARVRPERLRRFLQRLEALALFDLAEFDDLLGRTVGNHGHGRLRRALSIYRPPPFTRSELERYFETHGTRESFESDRVRDEDLLLAGFEVVRITGPRLAREPEQVMARLARLLSRRRRPGSSR